VVRSAPPGGGRLCVAPMMDCTDRHARFLLRLVTRRTGLYTEMVHAQAAVRAPQRCLGFSAQEHPVALQLGGSEPALLAQAARIGEDFGYDEINLNVGCPSPRVQEGRFGACLMAEPARVAECVAAMAGAVAVPVTVKCRTGLGRSEGGAPLDAFVEAVAAAGCRTFVVHARNAWLEGLSPHENRTVPPLRYETVYALKARRPELTVVLNGGVTTLAQARAHLTQVDGVMMGRVAYHAPYRLAEADAVLWDDPYPVSSRTAVLEAYLDYAQRQRAAGVPGTVLLKPLQGLYEGQPGARRWRRALNLAVASGDWRALHSRAAAA
jgi:tRNA-dihydrouridine synthase A